MDDSRIQDDDRRNGTPKNIPGSFQGSKTIELYAAAAEVAPAAEAAVRRGPVEPRGQGRATPAVRRPGAGGASPLPYGRPRCIAGQLQQDQHRRPRHRRWPMHEQERLRSRLASASTLVRARGGPGPLPELPCNTPGARPPADRAERVRSTLVRAKGGPTCMRCCSWSVWHRLTSPETRFPMSSRLKSTTCAAIPWVTRSRSTSPLDGTEKRASACYAPRNCSTVFVVGFF